MLALTQPDVPTPDEECIPRLLQHRLPSRLCTGDSHKECKPMLLIHIGCALGRHH